VPADVETEDLLRLLLGVVRARRELDAARLAAAAGQDLSLDDDRAAELLCGRARVLRRILPPALRDRDADAPEELLPLVLVQVHRRLTLTTVVRRADQLGMPRSVIGLCSFVGMTVGGYVPVLWGASAFSLMSLLFAGIGGVAGVWVGARLSA